MGKPRNYTTTDTIVEYRNIIRMGLSNYMALPPEWIRRHGIIPPCRVVVIAGDTLKILPTTQAILKEPPRPKEPPKVPCPFCGEPILPSAMESHINNYCLNAPIEAKKELVVV